MINNHQARRFALTHKQLRLRWRKQCRLEKHVRRGDDRTYVDDIRFAWNELARDEDGMWHYFVFDAIVMLLKNIQPYKRKLSNGTIGYYHSLWWSNENERAECMRIIEAAIEDIIRGVRSLDTPIDLPYAPTAVNIRIEADAQTVQNWPANMTLVPNAIVIPVFKAQQLEWQTQIATSRLAQAMRLTHYQTRSHPVDFFFAATVNKAQGATLERVVVFLPDRRKHEYKGTTVPSRTMRWSSHAAYTALSRVRLAAHMRCIGEGFEQTKESIANDMTFKPKIHAFMHGAINSLIRFARHVRWDTTVAERVYNLAFDAQQRHKAHRNEEKRRTHQLARDRHRAASAVYT